MKFLHSTLSLVVIVTVLLNPITVDRVLAEKTTTEVVSEIFSATSTPVNNEDIVATSTVARIAEPTIRVGLFKTADVVSVVSEAYYNLYAGNQFVVAVPANEPIKFKYQAGLYSAESSSISFSAPRYLRLVPNDPADFFTITSYSRPVKGRGKNFNVYRGTLEYRFSPKSKLPYVINELPLEEYVAGVAESADSVPTEYAKALLVAARSYAYAMLGTPPSEKHMFDVYATTQDQIYLGYNSEQMMPNITAAALSTAGEMVTYNDVPVITPYFGHSNGHTKSWPAKTKQAARPWLKSVVATYDKGKTMWGHGYGMSTHDAEMHAKKDGWTYDQILKYYYTGTEVTKMY